MPVSYTHLAEKAERQLAKPLRQTQAGGLDLTVHQAVGGLVLLEMREKGEKYKYHEASPHRQSRRPVSYPHLSPLSHSVYELLSVA